MLELSDRDAPKVTITPGTSSKDGWKTWSYCEDYWLQVRLYTVICEQKETGVNF